MPDNEQLRQDVTADESESAGAALRRFAQWAAEVKLTDVPVPVVTRLKQSVRDGLGCAVFGSDLPWARIVAEALAEQSGGTGPATIWGSGTKVDVASAAVANGTAVQSYELDDMHSEASVHGSSTMLPATLALAEHRGNVSGADLLTALAVGWEAAVRVNRCIGHILVNGWHPPTIMGTIAATAAAGRLLGLSAGQMYHCLSLGLLQASGLTVVQFGGMAKRLYAGRAAQAGVQSALLAERGFTAPDNVIGEPVGGFLTSFAPGRLYEVNALTRGLGNDFAAGGICFKLYSCCGSAHPALDMLADIVVEHPEATVDTIEHIGIELTEHSYKHIGFRYVPDTAVTAQFSVEYCLAAFLLEGTVFVEQFRDELLADQRILDIVSRTTTSCDPTLESKQDLRTKRAVRLRLTLRDGQVIQREGMFARGYADRPASEGELRSKFDRLVKGNLTAAKNSELSDVACHLESLPDVKQLVSICSADAEVAAR